MPTADELISPASIRELARVLNRAHPVSQWGSVQAAAGQLGPLGLSDRARAVAAAIASDAPRNYAALADVIRAALRDPGLAGWMVWPVTEAVAAAATQPDAGGDLEDGLHLLAELTPRLTSEFAIRTFLNADLDRTLATVQAWTQHEDPAVRRLASEGTRPKLPWARQVPAITRNPAATIPVLDRLYADESDFVRRSVANHLNDTSRLDPGLAVRTAARWNDNPGEHTGAVIRKAMRTLVKKGDPRALTLVGFTGGEGSFTVTGPDVATPRLQVGEDLIFTATVTNTSGAAIKVAVDYVIGHLKANGTQAPHVFKLATRTLAPWETTAIRRSHPFRVITTRRYYPGPHSLRLQVNGHLSEPAAFTLDAPEPAAALAGLGSR